MARKSPRFRNPPVAETVLSVQFVPIAGWTSAHFGRYWATNLNDGWTKITDAPALLDQFELFGDERKWGYPGGGLIFRPGHSPARVQISNETGDRMIQVQPTRFMYNWQKGDEVYPSYETMRGEFDSFFDGFRRFVANAGLGEVTSNQWEITYVDLVPQGHLWNTPAEWHRVLPGILPAKNEVGSAALESTSGEWHYVIGSDRGRIHLTVQSGRLDPTVSSEVLRLEMTARGPVNPEKGWGLTAGLDLGHDAVIDFFMKATSAEAHEVWGIERD